MNNKVKRAIHHTNIFLAKPISVAVILLFLFLYFAYANIQFQKDNQVLLKNTKQSVDNSQTIIKNLETAVADLKADNERQTRYIGCLMAVHGQGNQVSDDVKSQCSVMSSGIDITDVTRPNNSTQTDDPSAQDQSTNTDNGQNETPPGLVKRAQTLLTNMGKGVQSLAERVGL